GRGPQGRGGGEGRRARRGGARAGEEQPRAGVGRLGGEARGGPPLPLSDAAQERLRGASEQVGIVTRDPSLLAAFRDLEKAARSSLPILVAGDTGARAAAVAPAGQCASPPPAAPRVWGHNAARPAQP